MLPLTITDVRAVPGDSAFLIDDGETAVLCDTGFGFTGYAVADNIRRILGNRPLDYILLTHSHYDHALGSVYLRKRYPNVQVVAGAYAQKIFQKPTARAVMRDLDRKAAMDSGVAEYEDLIDELRADISVSDGDTIRCGRMEFTAVELPGHTKCSVGYYLAENQLLLASESLGVYIGDGVYLSSFLVGYQMTLDSIRKAGVPVFVLYESPHRIVDLVEQLAEVWPQCMLCVCSDLTKRYEKMYRGTAPEVLALLSANPNVDKGEYCMAVDISMLPPMEEKTAPQMTAEVFLLARILEGDDFDEAVEAAKDAGYPRNELYKAKLRVSELFEEE